MGISGLIPSLLANCLQRPVLPPYFHFLWIPAEPCSEASIPFFLQPSLSDAYSKQQSISGIPVTASDGETDRQLSLSCLSIITFPPSSSPFLYQTACRNLSSYSISTLWVIFKPCGVTAFFFIVNCLSSSLLTFSQSIV